MLAEKIPSFDWINEGPFTKRSSRSPKVVQDAVHRSVDRLCETAADLNPGGSVHNPSRRRGRGVGIVCETQWRCCEVRSCPRVEILEAFEDLIP